MVFPLPLHNVNVIRAEAAARPTNDTDLVPHTELVVMAGEPHRQM